MGDIPAVPEVKLPERIKAARLAAHLTAEELAEALGVSRQYISQIENRRRQNVTPCFLNNACWRTLVSPAYMLGRDVPPRFELLMQAHMGGWLTDQTYDGLDDLIIGELLRRDVTLDIAERRTIKLGLGPLRPTKEFKPEELPFKYACLSRQDDAEN